MYDKSKTPSRLTHHRRGAHTLHPAPPENPHAAKTRHSQPPGGGDLDVGKPETPRIARAILHVDLYPGRSRGARVYYIETTLYSAPARNGGKGVMTLNARRRQGVGVGQ